jgi:hypothetical protein
MEGVLNLKVLTGNAAFDDSDEIARVLRTASRQLDPSPDGRTSRVLRDINGNVCGSWEFIPTDHLDRED